MKKAIEYILENLKKNLSTDEYNRVIMEASEHLHYTPENMTDAVDIDEKVAIIEDLLINRKEISFPSERALDNLTAIHGKKK